MIHFQLFQYPENFPSIPSGMAEWLASVAEEEGFRLIEISYRWLTDGEMLHENQRLLDHDYYTDVITYGEVRGTRIYGDVIISHERVVDHANELGVVVEDERDRVMVHSLLHLCGYDDQTDVERLKMREIEDYYLNKRSF